MYKCLPFLLVPKMNSDFIYISFVRFKHLFQIENTVTLTFRAHLKSIFSHSKSELENDRAEK